MTWMNGSCLLKIKCVLDSVLCVLDSVLCVLDSVLCVLDSVLCALDSALYQEVYLEVSCRTLEERFQCIMTRN